MSDDGICGGDVPPLMGDVLTGTGLTWRRPRPGSAG